MIWLNKQCQKSSKYLVTKTLHIETYSFIVFVSIWMPQYCLNDEVDNLSIWLAVEY